VSVCHVLLFPIFTGQTTPIKDDNSSKVVRWYQRIQQDVRCLQKSLQRGTLQRTCLSTSNIPQQLCLPLIPKLILNQAGVKDVITIFHAPKSPASIRAHTVLKQAAANAQATATQDQASSHPQQPKMERSNFELGMHQEALYQCACAKPPFLSYQVRSEHSLSIDVQEGQPTDDQLTNIIEYLGQDQAGTVVEGATSLTDALTKFKRDVGLFKKPVVVDWSHGKAGIKPVHRGQYRMLTSFTVTGDNESEILSLLKNVGKGN